MNKIFFLVLILISLFFYLFTFRGDFGNPTPKQIDLELSKPGKAFETSQERSRYAIILSLVNDHSFAIDKYASMGTPDIGRINNHFYSFFPPATSILAIPLYLLGSYLGAAQLFTFFISTIFALFTIVLIYIFAIKLKLHWSIAVLSALSFGFATNAWGYSVTLYAHLISAFLLLSGLYVVLIVNNKYKSIKAIAAWFLYALAVFVDFPNLFVFLPIVAIVMLNSFEIKDIGSKINIKLNWIVLLSPFVFFLLMGVYGYYNQVHFGSPFKLSNTIPRVKDLKEVNLSIPESGSDATGALKTRNLLQGLHSFTISYDRGILIYSPIVVLFIFGVGFLKKNRKWIEIGLISVPAVEIVLYSMFGDPYGGWAFGSRYMIAAFPALCILMGIGLQRFYKNIFIKLLYSGVFVYSVAISLLAPLTTNVIPPYVEARNLGIESWFIVNWKMLQFNELNSFLYNTVFENYISGFQYYLIILLPVSILGIVLIWTRKNQYEDN